MRRASRVDGNHEEIVKALRKIGARTIYLREPVDLLVGFRGRNILLELKDGAKTPGNRPITANEQAFVETWPGQVAVVSSVDEALLVVAEMGRPER